MSLPLVTHWQQLQKVFCDGEIDVEVNGFISFAINSATSKLVPQSSKLL
jgi:hypothetical protein